MLGNEVLSRAPVELETEADAYAYLESLRWGQDGPTECPHCGSQKGAWYLKPKDPGGRKSKGGSTARSQRRVWKCRENSCRRQFSVLTNTVLHATKMPVRAWVGAITDLCCDPAGVSARDISDRWDVTEKSAWAMLTRIQDALAEPEVAGAGLASNAPLWFELAGAQRQHIEHERAQRDQAEQQAAAARIRAEQEAAEQVRSDVERALAEAFSEPLPGVVAPKIAPSTSEAEASKPGVKSGDVGVSAPAESGVKSTDDGVRRSTPALHDDARAATEQPVPAAQGADYERARKERKQATGSGGNPLVKTSTDPSRQPVDNAPAKVAGETDGTNIADRATAPSLNRSERRRARRERQSEIKQVERPQDDSLGDAWLGGPGQSRDHDVSLDQGQPLGIDARELGPAWASSPSDKSDKSRVGRRALPDQADVFDDD